MAAHTEASGVDGSFILLASPLPHPIFINARNGLLRQDPVPILDYSLVEQQTGGGTESKGGVQFRSIFSASSARKRFAANVFLEEGGKK